MLDAGGGLLVLGNTYSENGDVANSHGGIDFWLLKLYPNGQLVWQKTYGGNADDETVRIIQTADGGFMILGTTESNNGDVTQNHGKSDIWLVKIDSEGNLEWQKTYGGSDYDYAGSILQTTDGGYILSGSSYSLDGDLPPNSHGNADLWIAKLDTTGVIEWSKRYGGAGTESGGTLLATSDSGYIITASSGSEDGDAFGNHGYFDVMLLKLDSTGVIEWRKMLGGNGYDSGRLIPADDGGYLLFGTTSSNDGIFVDNHGYYDVWLSKIDANGTVQWNKFYGGSEYEGPGAMIHASDGNYVFVAFTGS